MLEQQNYVRRRERRSLSKAELKSSAPQLQNIIIKIKIRKSTQFSLIIIILKCSIHSYVVEHILMLSPLLLLLLF